MDSFLYSFLIFGYLLITTINGGAPPFNSTWYQEQLEGSTLLQSSDYLIWNLTKSHGTTVNILTQFKAQEIKSVGDKVEIEFSWLSNGTNECESKYWTESEYNYQCEYNISGDKGQSEKCAGKSANCLIGTGDFRIVLFESNGTVITSSNYSDQIFVNMRGYEIRFNPHLSTKATRFEPYTGSTQKPCSWYLREDVSNDPFDKSEVGDWTGCFQIDIGKPYNFKFEMEIKENNTMYLKSEMNNWSVSANHQWTLKNQTQWIPKYIDTMVIEFPNERPYQFIKLDYKQ